MQAIAQKHSPLLPADYSFRNNEIQLMRMRTSSTLHFIALFVLLTGLVLTTMSSLFVSSAFADNETLSDLQTRRTQVEQRIRNIADAPARPGESLNDEIRRKGEDTRELRQELEQLDTEIAALQAQQNETPAEQPPAVTTGNTSTSQPETNSAAEPNEFDTVPRGAGYNAEVVDGPGRFGEGDKANIPEADDTTTWIRNGSGNYAGSFSRYSQNPNDRGWWADDQGRIHTTIWRSLTTECKACERLVGYFNRTMGQVLSNRKYEQELRWRKQHLRQQLFGNTPTERDVTRENSSDTRLLTQYAELVDAYDGMIERTREETRQLEQEAKDLAHQVSECEAQCREDEETDTTGITPGGWGGWVPQTSEGTETSRLPFTWRGPYSTDCWNCEKLATALNELPSRAYVVMELLREEMQRLNRFDQTIALNRASNGNGYNFDSEDGDYITVERARELRGQIEREITRLRERLQFFSEYHDRVLRMLNDCEREHCPDRAQDRRVGCMMPGDSGNIMPGTLMGGTGTVGDAAALCSVDSIELEYVVSVSGTNPLNPYEIQRIPYMLNNTDGMTPMTPVTPVVPVTPTIPVVPTTPVTPVTPTTPPTTPTEPVPPVATPLVVNAAGAVNFTHIVGTSSCPQPAGSITVTSNNGNPLTISNVSDSGSIASRLDESVVSNNVATPQISAQFNCSSAQNGTFSGTISGIATDMVTGETANFSVPATGTVTGP